jgi:hypothetical protein
MILPRNTKIGLYATQSGPGPLSGPPGPGNFYRLTPPLLGTGLDIHIYTYVVYTILKTFSGTLL